MEYETEEQQVEALKNWWAENGRAVIAGVVLGVAVIGGWTLWQGHKESKNFAASDSYSLALEAADASNAEEALSLADKVQDDNPDHLYATYASFAAARVAIESGDLDEAAGRLEWSVRNAVSYTHLTLPTKRIV